MTELIYFRDCYVKEFDAEVEKSKGEKLVLNRTAFYPEGGGQPSDTGRINGVTVEKVEKKGGEVEHILSDNPFEVGEKVHCELDWDKRYAYMLYHTAQHVLSAIILKKLGGETTGNQVYENKARIDFDVDISDRIELIEGEVNSVIDEERDVEIYTMDREEALEKLDPKRTRINLLPDSVKELRIVEIENLDKTACAGTHVSNTSELERFEIKNTINKGKDRNRVEFELLD